MKKWILGSVLLFLGTQGSWGEGADRPLIFINTGRLSEAKEGVQNEKEPFLSAFQRLKGDADKALKLEPFTVVSKREVPPSGDKHDYLSLAIYWWPNPNTSNGLPYVNRDGRVNPEVEKIPDHKSLERMVRSVQTLSLAYSLTGGEVYARKAAQLLRAWFLAPATRMNPNLNYAQVIKGKKEKGNFYGIIDARGLGQIPDCVTLLSGSREWSPKDQAALRKWFSDYLDWLLADGKKEGEAKNNHGFWYDAQAVPIALFVGEKEWALHVLKDVTTRRISGQIEPDGKMPLELKRTKSLHYCLFNLEAMFHLAQAGQSLGVDLWNFQTADGRGIRKVLDFLLPYLAGKKVWPYEEISPKGSEKKEAFRLLYWAKDAYHDKTYEETRHKLEGEIPTEDMDFLIH